MAAKCWQKSCPVKGKKDRYALYEDKDYYLNSLKNPYFSKLKKDFNNTELYNSVYSTCVYFKDYVSSK